MFIAKLVESVLKRNDKARGRKPKPHSLCESLYQEETTRVLCSLLDLPCPYFRLKNAMRAHSNERDHFFDNISEQLNWRCVCVLAGMIRLICEKFTEVLGLKCLQTTWYFWDTVRAVKYKQHWIYVARWVTIVFWKQCKNPAVRVLSFQCSN